MGNTSSFGIGSSKNVPVTRKFTESGKSETQGIRYAVSGMQGMRNTMEDRHLHCHSVPVQGQDESALDDHSIFAVFDGHGGDFTSSFLESNFLKYFSQRSELKKYAALPRTGMKSRADVTGVQLLKQALVKTFLELDHALVPLQLERNHAIASEKLVPQLSQADSDTDDEDDNELDDLKISPAAKPSSPISPPSLQGERSGSTCVVVMLTPTHIICANAGDSRAVLRRNGDVLPLSFDHKPSDVPERKRIVNAGGTVKAKRVDGDLAVSRAFGDFAYKQDKTLPVEKQKVIVVPDLVVYPRSEDIDEFIVVACDGIWDVASSKQCTDFIQMLLSEGEHDLGNVCEEALDTCLDRKSRDNMTLMIIGLPGIKTDVSGSAVVNNALWGHRSSRRTRAFTTAATDVTHRACLAVGRQCITVEQSITCST
jgi:serine/threonine protein phosphatase PrpC